MKQRTVPVSILLVCIVLQLVFMQAHLLPTTQDDLIIENNDDIGPSSDVPLEPFAFVEAANVFGMRYEDAERTLGTPLSTNVSGDEMDRLVDFKEVSIAFSGEQIQSAVFESDVIAHPRGICIGDNLQSVLSKFPDTSDLTEYFDEENGGMYRTLYGEYVSLAQFGVLYHYDDAMDTKQLIVSDSDFTVKFYFEKDILCRVIYQLGVS